jgi:flagellar motility protein MotE (MotC chaperone)
MNRRIVLIAIALLLTILMGCETYTARSAKESIQAPTPVAEGELVTKYSLVEAEAQAEKEAKEAARLAEQERQAEAEELQRYEAMQESIASLEAEKSQLESNLKETSEALREERLTTKDLRTLIDESNLLAEELQATITTLESEI